MMRHQFISEEQFAELVKRRDTDPIDGSRSSTDARRTTQKGSSCEAANQQTKSRRGESASSPIPPFTLSLIGQIPSGKNQVQLLWRNGKVHRYPNKTFTNWRAKSSIEILEQYGEQPVITHPICLTCNYWPGNAITRDVSGQLDAIFSLLVYAMVLKNDGLVYSVWWRRHTMNRKFPKLVMDIEAWYE